MISRFVAYRRDPGLAQTHNTDQRNSPDAPQFCGAIFPDGSVAVKWLTAVRSVSVFNSLEDVITIHGHPEYGTELQFLDGDTPGIWLSRVEKHALSCREQLGGKLVYTVGETGQLEGLRLENESTGMVMHFMPWKPTEWRKGPLALTPDGELTAEFMARTPVGDEETTSDARDASEEAR